jgi:hypothetical protein
VNRFGENDMTVSGTYWAPSGVLSQSAPRLLVLATPDEQPPQEANSENPRELAEAALKQGLAVFLVNRYSGIESSDQFANFYCTYNLTKLQTRVRDLATVCAAASSMDPRKSISFRVILAGTRQAGIWALLAAPAADAVVADVAALDTADEQAFLATDLFCPGLLSIGGPEGAAMLAAPHWLLLHNTGAKFATSHLQSTYKAASVSGRIRIDSSRLTDREIVTWLGQLKE